MTPVETGWEVSPCRPTYHWYCRPVPVASTPSQYFVSTVGVSRMLEVNANGMDGSPGSPLNHWYVRAPYAVVVGAAVTDSVTFCPLRIVWLSGGWDTVMRSQDVTLTKASALRALWHPVASAST